MKITDGKKTVEIKIQRWNGSCKEVPLLILLYILLQPILLLFDLAKLQK